MGNPEAVHESSTTQSADERVAVSFGTECAAEMSLICIVPGADVSLIPTVRALGPSRAVMEPVPILPLLV